MRLAITLVVGWFSLTPASACVELSGTLQKTYPPSISLGCYRFLAIPAVTICNYGIVLPNMSLGAYLDEIGPDEFMLVINAGSGSFKFGLFDTSGQETLASGVIDRSEPLAPKASWLDSRSLTWGKHPIVTVRFHRLP